MSGFARKMLDFARKFFQDLCSRSLGDRSKFSYARNARPFFRSRSLGSKIQNQKLCSRSLGSKISMLEMLEIDVFAARSQLYCKSCGKCFGHYSDLKLLVKMVHENIKPHKCDSCEKSYTSKAELNTHIAIVHEGTN